MYFQGEKELTNIENSYTIVLLKWDDSVDIMP